MKCFLKVKFLGCADLVFANWGGGGGINKRKIS
jgi:hypothetical protein